MAGPRGQESRSSDILETVVLERSKHIWEYVRNFPNTPNMCFWYDGPCGKNICKSSGSAMCGRLLIGLPVFWVRVGRSRTGAKRIGNNDGIRTIVDLSSLFVVRPTASVYCVCSPLYNTSGNHSKLRESRHLPTGEPRVGSERARSRNQDCMPARKEHLGGVWVFRIFRSSETSLFDVTSTQNVRPV